MKTTNYSKNFAMVAVASLCVTGFAMGAHADESDVTVRARTVHYSDLNLNSQAGADTLYRRIQTAATQVCGNVDSRLLEEAAAAKACVAQAVANSVHAVNSGRLTNAYNAHLGVVQTNLNIASVR